MIEERFQYKMGKKSFFFIFVFYYIINNSEFLIFIVVMWRNIITYTNFKLVEARCSLSFYSSCLTPLWR